MPNSFKSSVVTVATTPTLLVASANPFEFTEAVIYNPGPSHVYFGGESVTAGTGGIPSGASLSIQIADPADKPYGIVTSGTQQVHVVQQRLVD
jgi:hypothetical protein